MGKTKQSKEKKFDRNVEISAPILDPEVIKQIHSPPKEKSYEIRNGGFKALLSDFNSQDSTDEVTPIMETNHLPSYIGISCAVSGYSNYSAYNKRPLEDISNAQKIEPTRQTKVASANRHSRVLSSPSRSQTSSPSTTRIDSHLIHHITVDRSNINSADQERKELTEKLTASASERRRSPSPLAPTEDDRHHGAYVGARYCPMPPPSKLVHKHIPLLGIDDDQDPDDYVEDDVNKVEEKIATLYGEDFVEDWKESMSHKSKKEHFEEEQNKKSTLKNPKDLVTLKPTPVKTPEPGENLGVIDVPTPNVKVLAGVEKQFLNRLLTDDNPPMPKSPSPQPTSPVSSPKMARQQLEIEQKTSSKGGNSAPSALETKNVETPKSRIEQQRSPSPAIESPASPDSQKRFEPQSHSSTPTPASPEPVSPSPVAVASPQHKQIVHPESPSVQESGDIFARDIDGEQADLIKVESPDQQELASPLASPNLNQQQFGSDDDLNKLNHQVDIAGEEHIEYEIRAQSPVDNQSSPVKVLEIVEPQPTEGVREDKNLVSFSPEPSVDVTEALKLESQRFHEQAQDGGVDLLAMGGEKSENLTQVTESERQEQFSKVDNAQLQGDVSTIIDAEKNPVTLDDSNNRDGHYFLNLLKQEESFINDQVQSLEMLLAERESEMDEDTLGKFRSAIGKANLLINKKCNQFRELCERGINRDASDQYAVLDDDLAGFWDMLSIQIDDVRKSFHGLAHQ